MEWINKTDVLIVGLGLLGGSYAKALKRLGYHVEAIDIRKEAIDYATANGIIDVGFDHVNPEAIGKADAVIFALYPDVFLKWIRENQKYFKKGAYITDVTGVKKAIVYEIQSFLRDDVEYIAAHPMAGREVGGVENSNDAIFRDANYLVVPTEKNTEKGIEWCRRLGMILGFARISVLTPEEHDEMIGFVSQLTHVISVALMTCKDNAHLSDYTGDSFRDLTRIARINDKLWSELFLMNRETLLDQMDIFIKEMNELRDIIAAKDEEKLREKLRLSCARRAIFDKNK